MRPTWVTIVGILGIIFGLFGVMGAAQTAFMPKMLEMQKAFLSSMPMPTSTPRGQVQVEQFQAMAQAMFGENPRVGLSGISDTRNCWRAVERGLCVRRDFTAAMKRYSIRLLYSVIAIGVVFAVARGLIFVKAYSMMGATMAMGSLSSIVIDLILLAVVATGDKRGFVQEAGVA